MNSFIKIVGSVIAVGLMLCGLVYINNSGNREVTLGSIQDGQAYNATTTSYVWASVVKGQSIKTGNGTLGSIVIGNATAVGTLDLYDATSTDTLGVLGTSTRLLAKINTATVGATFVYDVAFSKGLLAIPSATLATSTITFR